MIRHVVMWTLHDPADAGRFRDALLSCAALDAGTLAYAVGTRSDGLAANCDVCLVADFADGQALEAYQQHPKHVAMSNALTPLRAARHVLDFFIA